MIVVSSQEATLKFNDLLMAVESKHEVVQIYRNGKAIAELIPMASSTLPLHPRLQGVKVLGDLTEPLSDDERPEEYR